MEGDRRKFVYPSCNRLQAGATKPFGKRISGYSLGNSLNDTRI